MIFSLLQEWEAASKAVKDEEAIKQKLCEDLNNLVYMYLLNVDAKCLNFMDYTFDAIMHDRSKKVVMLSTLDLRH